MPVLTLKVRHDYHQMIYKFLLPYTVVVPTKGPCATNNGGCDQICSDETGVVQCYCEAGYFSIAFLPTKCFGESLGIHCPCERFMLRLCACIKYLTSFW